MTAHKQTAFTTNQLQSFLKKQSVREGILFFLLTLATAAWTRWLSADIGNFSPLWPPAGLMIAAVLHRLSLTLPIAAGVFFWVVLIEGHPLTYGLFSMLTFSGALIYGLVMRTRDGGSLAEVSAVKDLYLQLRDLLLYAAIPAALVGSHLHADQLQDAAYIDLFAVYLISETAGILLFAPAACAYLAGNFSRRFWIAPAVRNKLYFIVTITLLPLMAHWLDQPEYAQGLFLLVFPMLCWIAVQNENLLLVASMLLITLVHLTLEASGVGVTGNTATVFSLVERVIWLLAAFVMSNTLLAYSCERQFAFDEIKRQAIQDDNTGWRNQRGLEEFIEVNKDQSLNILITQVCRRDMLIGSFSLTEHRALEQALTEKLSQLKPWLFKARLSDLTYCFLTPANMTIPLEEEKFQTLFLEKMDITLRMAWCCVPLNTQNHGDSLLESYTGLQRALAKPISRVTRRAQANESLCQTQSPFVHFQKVVSALEAGRLCLWGQPIHPVANTMPSIELLARIKSPEGDIINPGVFLNVLNLFDELELLDRAVLVAAVAENGPLHQLPKYFGRININLSGSTLCDITFVDWLERIWPANLARDNICLEITESELIRNLEIAQETAGRLRAIGFQMAIDDFGSGLASFEYLEHFPADLVKIDGMFIKDITQNKVHQAMAASTVAVTKSIGAQSCAEFVGDEASVALLSDMGIDYLQGFYLAKPQPVESFYDGYSLAQPSPHQATG